MTLVLLKGSQTGKSVVGVVCGTWQFWLILASGVPFVLIVIVIVASRLKREHDEKIRLGFIFLVKFIFIFVFVLYLIDFFYFYFIFIFIFFYILIYEARRYPIYCQSCRKITIYHFFCGCW